MVVVVGKPKYPTPMMSAYVRFASLNPYWFVPPDLAAERIAPKVLKQGLKYLDTLGYQIMADWKPDPRSSIPRRSIGKRSPTARPRSSCASFRDPHNSMGRMKFMFPNEAGVYLHDNPERELFTEASRLYSGGCVRLEDAPRLGRWLFGHDLDWKARAPNKWSRCRRPCRFTSPILPQCRTPTARPSPFMMTSTAAMRRSWRRSKQHGSGCQRAALAASGGANSGNR